MGARATILMFMDPNDLETNLERDYHADAYCLGESVLVLTDYGIPVHVHSYDPALGANIYLTISGSLLYDHLYMGRTYQIMITQLIITDLNHHMLCRMQVRTK